MLINATQQEELRIALVDGQRLYDLDIESIGHEQKKANIYKGKITKINPSLEAAFVSYGGERDGFLPLKEVAENYFPNNVSGRRSIKNLQEGQEVLVQIEKEIRGKKGAALTTYISLAGSYLVLMPNDPRAGGVSRRIEGEERADLKRIIDALEKPRGMGVIARTAGVGKTQEELQQDLDALVNYWTAIQNEAQLHTAPSLIHKESDIITRAFRDYLRDDVGEILIDNPKVLEIAKKRLVDLGRVEYLSKLKSYAGDISLFSHFQIEGQIESAFQREVRLPSGGSIVIDVTEALTAIDINSAKSIRGSDIEETAFNTNIEAADEIARQLRLRDLGGLIVIDFIDMTPIRNQREVENRLKDALKMDRARIQTTRISRFGLLEMSRQRLSPSLREATHHICPRCQGTGTVRDNNSLSLSILRLIQEEALKDNTVQIDVIVPVPIASYLLNEKRRAITSIENMYPDVKIVIAADEEMETPLYKVIRKRRGEETDVLSYNLPKLIRELEEDEDDPIVEFVQEEAVLTGPKVELSPTTKPAEQKVKSDNQPGLIASLFGKLRQLFANDGAETPKEEKKAVEHKGKESNYQRRTPNRRPPRQSVKTSHSNDTESTDTVVAKEAPKNSRKVNSRQNKNNNINNDIDNSNVENAIAPTTTKPKEIKPRRQPRKLVKSVRTATVTHDNAVNDTESTTLQDAKLLAAPIVIPSILLPVVMPTTQSVDKNSGNTTPNRRNKRTVRHLRMNNNQRRRAKNNQPMSPVPLSMAVASPELAMAKVYVDYSLLASGSKKKSDTPTKKVNDKVSQVQNSVVIPTLLTPITWASAQQPSVNGPVNQTIVTPLNNEIGHEISLNNEHIAKVETTVAVNVTNSENLGYSSSIITKAPAPEKTDIDASKTINYRTETDYQFNGKGNAGGMSAQDHAYSDAYKPQSE